ncbi:tyrosinase family protein [Oerskovia flava]|uniref:tyrosinase family protein n=1 Tax=Oerskovia flava TaxID=2986422 RepID=UPI0022407412|nr:tyrosinase family protein [Oerskovia sp. JB1-3-2]
MSTLHQVAPDSSTAPRGRHRTAPPAYVRRDVWNLQPPGAPPHPVLSAYAAAVRALKEGPDVGHLSWTHHTQVHGMVPDPLDGLRNECQHQTWYFLPWHRVYLYHFEAICRSIIQGMPDVSDEVKDTWALPYWDYDRGPADDPARTLPLAFREPVVDGAPNPLFDDARRPGINAGNLGLGLHSTTAVAWFAEQHFTSEHMDVPTFGGPVTGFMHSDGPALGAVERTPHGDVHVVVGGPGGSMFSFERAGGDPIFWLHHANIDRLWEVWRTHVGVDPDLERLTESFEFLDVTGARRVLDWADVFDTPTLGYTYESTDVPDSVLRDRARRGIRPERPAPPIAGRGVGPDEPGDAERRAPAGPTAPPEVVAVSEAPVHLRRHGSDELDLGLGDRERRQALRATDRPADTGPERLLLVLEHITASAPPTGPYAVYAGPEQDEAAFVGTLPLFGLVESMSDAASHGLTYTFDVTEVARELRAQGRWDPASLHLSFRSFEEESGEPDQDGGEPEILVETVRLLVQGDG